MGDGTTSKYFKFDKFKAAIDHHLRKGNTFTVIDMTSYTTEQISRILTVVDISEAGAIADCPIFGRISDKSDKPGRQPDMQRRNLTRLRRGWLG